MRWLIDTDIFIEGEQENPAFLAWIQDAGDSVTADVVRGEFLFGVHCVRSEKLKQRGLRFYADTLSPIPSVSHEPQDFIEGARLAGEARRAGSGKPGLADGLIAATALRLAIGVATRNLKDFEAMGVECADPFAAKA
jgi:toxin FitB